MFRITSTRSAFGAVAVSAVAGIILFASHANAGVSSNFKKCDSSSRAETVGCCEYVMENEAPGWLRGGGGSCHQVVACKSYRGSRGGESLTHASATGRKYKRCYVQAMRLLKEREGGGNFGHHDKTPDRHNSRSDNSKQQ